MIPFQLAPRLAGYTVCLQMRLSSDASSFSVLNFSNHVRNVDVATIASLSVACSKIASRVEREAAHVAGSSGSLGLISGFKSYFSPFWRIHFTFLQTSLNATLYKKIIIQTS